MHTTRRRDRTENLDAPRSPHPSQAPGVKISRPRRRWCRYFTNSSRGPLPQPASSKIPETNRVPWRPGRLATRLPLVAPSTRALGGTRVRFDNGLCSQLARSPVPRRRVERPAWATAGARTRLTTAIFVIAYQFRRPGWVAVLPVGCKHWRLTSSGAGSLLAPRSLTSARMLSD